MGFVETAVRAVKAAGRIHLEYFGAPLDVKQKGGGDFSTNVDILAEREIITILKRKFPLHGILSEESGLINNSEDYQWIIDPLDGTPNYYHGNKNFCVLLALTKWQEPIIGVTWFPLTKELFLAEKSHGATKNGRSLHVSVASQLADMYGSTQISSKEPNRSSNINFFLKLLPKTHIEIAHACIGRQLCDIAEGSSDFHFRQGIHYWDYAAGALLVHEAGGIATDLLGAPIRSQSKNALVSNGQQHDQLRGLFHK